MTESLAISAEFRKKDPKSPLIFQCDSCEFSCIKKTDYDRHMTTSKHTRRAVMEQAPSNAPYHCELCDFTCDKECLRLRHISTEKHQFLVDSLDPLYTHSFLCNDCDVICSTQEEYAQHILTASHNSDSAERSDEMQKIYYCEKCDLRCSRQNDYARHIGTAKHKKAPNAHKRSKKPPENVVYTDPVSTDISAMQTIMQCVQTMVIAQSAQSEAHIAAQAEQTRLFIETINLAESRSITNNNNNHSNNTTNNQFNLNVFLNEDCKDAYTLKEVVDSIECTVKDLDRMDVDGYAATVTRKILESIQHMSITERPIHCTDVKRNAVCVKNETGWDRNEAAITRLNDSVFIVGRKLNNAVFEWREAYPDHYRGTVSRRDQYHRLIADVLKISDRQVEAKIVGIVCKGIVLDRKTAAVRS